jgi:hypothetical protein
MNLRIVSTLVVVFTLAGLSFQSLAGPADFSVCGDLSGPARGLCQAGVAIGCDSDNSSNACEQIAEQFENVAGEPPPYVPPDPYPPCECWSDMELKSAFPEATASTVCHLIGPSLEEADLNLLWESDWARPMARTSSFDGYKCSFGENAEAAWPNAIDLWESEYDSCNASMQQHAESIGVECILSISRPPPPDF